VRPAVIVSAVVALLVVGAGLVVAALGALRPDGRESRDADTDDAVAVARGTALPAIPPLAADLDLTAWADRTTRGTGVPARALEAYGGAERRQRAATPDCRLSWATLAAVGRIESDHGRLGRADLEADGIARPPIVGVPLDGSPGVAEIPDTDGGRLDGDPVHDRAVGPMQFLPGTWERYGADGDGDGVRDPNDLDDAAAAAAAYLCAGGRDTADGDGWWDGVLTYNRSIDYARRVWTAADRYATSPA
jgi:membrane-bound lytic murein transglycosylase B